MSVAAFYGGIGLLDFRLMGVRGTVPLKAFAHMCSLGCSLLSASPWSLVSRCSSTTPCTPARRAYWSPKLIAIALGLANAALFHRRSYVATLAGGRDVPASARVGGHAVTRVLDRRLSCFTVPRESGTERCAQVIAAHHRITRGCAEMQRIKIRA